MANVCLLAFGYSLFLSLKRLKAYQKHTAEAAVNACVLLFTVSACAAALTWPDLVSLKWGGLPLVIRLIATMLYAFTIAVIGLLSFAVTKLFRGSY